MDRHRHDHPDLTKNQSLVMGALSGSKVPMSAYTILDQLRDSGFKAPLQVYRALDKLVEFGMVHRLESLNAFVACSHPDCESHETIAFTICEACGRVGELSDTSLANRLDKIAGKAKFVLKRSVIELSGFCSACADH